MRHAFVMDPLEGVKAWKDTSYHLMLAAAERGHEVFHLDQRDLTLVHDRVFATMTPVEVTADMDDPFRKAAPVRMSMEDTDAIWIRTDPPMDRAYFYATLLLDFLPEKVRVINHPAAIRDWNEKLSALFFPAMTPDTLVSTDAGEMTAFVESRDRSVMKPVDGFGGKGIEFLQPGQSDLQQRIQAATAGGRKWVVLQEYLPAADLGDKRILLLDGVPLGAILRVHADGVELNNLDAGGVAHEVSLDERDVEICDAVGPELRARGIVFAGIDVIGGMLMEINVTSPTGLQEMSRFTELSLNHRIISSLEK